MCVSGLHHDDHSLALLRWFAATPFKKKKPYPRLLASFTPVCALLAAPYHNEAMHHCDPEMVLPCDVRCWRPASQCLGLGLGTPFRLSLVLPSVQFNLFPNYNVNSCPVLRPAGCTRKMVIDFAPSEGLSGFMLHKTAFLQLPGVRLAGCTQIGGLELLQH